MEGERRFKVQKDIEIDLISKKVLQNKKEVFKRRNRLIQHVKVVLILLLKNISFQER